MNGIFGIACCVGVKEFQLLRGGLEEGYYCIGTYIAWESMNS